MISRESCYGNDVSFEVQLYAFLDVSSRGNKQFFRPRLFWARSEYPR